MPSPVKQFALECGIPVRQPETLRDPEVVADIAALRPDLIVVVAYGLLLPGAVLDLPRLGCLNVHASLLPRWRGAAPIQQAILNGDAETGVCLMKMEAGLDTGPVFVCAATAIGPQETAGELHDRLALMGAKLLAEKLAAILAQELEPVAQDDRHASYAGKVRKEDAAIAWTSSAEEIQRKIRAYNPAPGAWFEFDGERVKCWKAVVLDQQDGKPGVILRAAKAGVDVACGAGTLRMQELQRPGRRKVSGAEFAAQQILTGKRLG